MAQRAFLNMPPLDVTQSVAGDRLRVLLPALHEMWGKVEEAFRHRFAFTEALREADDRKVCFDVRHY